MKKHFTLITVLAIFFAMNATATVWRVNNNTGVDADFNNLQTAVNDANVLPFDTIYVEGTLTSYGSVGVNKPLILFGAGYFLNENDTTQALKMQSNLHTITFSSGSSGSVITGFNITGGGGYSYTVKIYADNISIKKNRIHAAYQYGIIIIGDDLEGIIIHSNYITTPGYTGTTLAIYSTYSGLDVVIKNNYISKSSSIFYPHYSIKFTSNNPSGIEISNNIFGYSVETYSAVFLNNIMYNGEVTGDDNMYANNIGNAEQFGTENGNQHNVDMSTVFVDHTSGVDNGLLLATGSPAIGAGFNGEDCGIFGGNQPYVLSGLPPIPSIFEVTQSGIGSENLPIQVNLKAKSNR